MNWNNYKTYGDSHQNAFETLCNQLFERYLRRNHENDLIKFRVINGAGGDGGIEAYGELVSGDIIAVQAKWFRQSLGTSEIEQIKNSILTAKKLRHQIKKYIICIPHNTSSLKIGRDNKPTTNHEENKINDLIDKIYATHPDLELIWWFDNEILAELQQNDNEGIHTYWFDKELISQEYLSQLLNLQKKGWLHERYIPELHGQGEIRKEYQKICFSVEYRQELLHWVDETTKDLKNCLMLIDKFLPTNQATPLLNEKLNEIKNNLTLFDEELQRIANALQSGNDLYKPSTLTEVDVWSTLLKLEKIAPSNIQKSMIPKLISSLEKNHPHTLQQFIQRTCLNFRQSIRLIVGEPGTGKTHGLVNCTETHLKKNSPAIIIQAKGSPSGNWTEILSKALQLTNWNMNEILSALETLAMRNDVQKATIEHTGEDTTNECTKVLICIDGLEEDIENKKEWYDRIRECEQLVIDYPRVRFFFSARSYFYDKTKIPASGIFETHSLPREGDIEIMKIAPKYFSKEHYNIQIASYSQIRSIDSLLSLRLFCEEYQDQNILETDTVITATGKLINRKIERINEEFTPLLQNKISTTRNPISDALDVIANYFYSNHEIEHDQLVQLIISQAANYLNTSDIDSLIDYLANNAFLIRTERISEDVFLKKKKSYYSITYQSLIEHIISDGIYREIKNGRLEKIPPFLHKAQKIIQNIANNLFIETGQLIGENNFLIEGFNEREMKVFQLTAISNAPKDLALKYKPKVDELFYSGYDNLSCVFEYLILPSSRFADSVFGAEYLHAILSKMPSAFDRDRLWSGLDNHEKNIQGVKPNQNTILLKESGVMSASLDCSFHNEMPLVCAWGLSTIDQELRDKLRIKLTGWAIKKPFEFHLLLQKVFDCNDPQIQEDLASIALGFASRVKDKKALKELASWSIDNIFTKLEQHRNVIVRQGFRALAERAFQVGAITKDEVELCRPKPMKEIFLLPFEKDVNIELGGECYPIAHDLAWYVIKKAYDDFFESPLSLGKRLKDNDCKEAKEILNAYRVKYNNKKIFGFYWGMAAGIGYIKSLGFTRTKGNGYTEATHGSKSKVFTYEEKYTWLAVHYIQGYLSDYIPMKKWPDERFFVKDYSQLIDIPNPAESLVDTDAVNRKQKEVNEWVIKDLLMKELETGSDIKGVIEKWVNEEPSFDLEKWLSFESADFQLSEPNRRWTAIYNDTGLYDSKQLCYSQITLTACLVYKKDLPILKKAIRNNPDTIDATFHTDSLYASPNTDMYCNPTDIVWMNWIEENNRAETFYDNCSGKELLYTITKLIQIGVDGESHHILPSKKIRELIRCYDFVDMELQDLDGNTLSFIHKISDGQFQDNQEIILVDSNVLEKALTEAGYEIVWFAELFRQKNTLNKDLDKEFHPQRTRKYFIWNEDVQKSSFKFWDAQYSHRRDKN
jgi:hypothetical protein